MVCWVVVFCAMVPQLMPEHGVVAAWSVYIFRLSWVVMVPWGGDTVGLDVTSTGLVVAPDGFSVSPYGFTDVALG